MNNQSRLDPTALRSSYKTEGWERHDTAAAPMTEAEIAASRERYRSL